MSEPTDFLNLVRQPLSNPMELPCFFSSTDLYFLCFEYRDGFAVGYDSPLIIHIFVILEHLFQLSHNE